MLKQVVEERIVNKLGISVGTALALEAVFKDMVVFDNDRLIPDKIDPTKYNTHIFNIYTLFRNVINSIKHSDKDQLVVNRYVKEQLINDMYLIIELYSNVETKLMFYMPDYTNTYKVMNKGKEDKPLRSFVTHTHMVNSLKGVKLPGDIYKGNRDVTLPATTDKVLILTHFLIDLLNATQIPNLTLLESHTGKVKTKVMWSNKYHPIGKRDLKFIPINKKVLYILGDKTLVKPLDITTRKSLYELITTKRWNPTTSRLTVDKVLRSFKNDIPV